MLYFNYLAQKQIIEIFCEFNFANNRVNFFVIENCYLLYILFIQKAFYLFMMINK